MTVATRVSLPHIVMRRPGHGAELRVRAGGCGHKGQSSRPPSTSYDTVTLLLAPMMPPLLSASQPHMPSAGSCHGEGRRDVLRDELPLCVLVVAAGRQMVPRTRAERGFMLEELPASAAGSVLVKSPQCTGLPTQLQHCLLLLAQEDSSSGGGKQQALCTLENQGSDDAPNPKFHASSAGSQPSGQPHISDLPPLQVSKGGINM